MNDMPNGLLFRRKQLNTVQPFSRTRFVADSVKTYDSRQTNITWSINSPIFLIDPPFLSWYHEKGTDPEYSKNSFRPVTPIRVFG